MADKGYSRVLRFVAPFSTGMAATGVLGQPDFTTSTFAASATKMRTPYGVAADRVGNVIVVDSGNARVLAFDRPFDFCSTRRGTWTATASPTASSSPRAATRT